MRKDRRRDREIDKRGGVKRERQKEIEFKTVAGIMKEIELQRARARYYDELKEKGTESERSIDRNKYPGTKSCITVIFSVLQL